MHWYSVQHGPETPRTLESNPNSGSRNKPAYLWKSPNIMQKMSRTMPEASR